METKVTCNCQMAKYQEQLSWKRVSKKSARSVPSILLSILIAFFPKCPVCWAVYMSMFGSIGLAKLPYMPWLLPILAVFLLFHVGGQFRAIPLKGPLPFIFSLAGASCLLLSRFVPGGTKVMMIGGMAAIIIGSLLAAFMPHGNYSKRINQILKKPKL
ncbi:hypothetical protein SAMN05444266_10973 [Chitinophaga jiangningensis]|uniref:MerC mercury resistance protein n=1 Tax=Chitinophaga jiangningensis TaxID=1419482 RepID=A0A1M7JYX0_9BACT|nr:hypothetical protein [Chitinophaga jiangningensis]SHM58111.1 hypothetical protein SAMN05444266_10973 [Chitinophaga jiangningensis]